MIGYSKTARRLYHKASRNDYWAKCDAIWLLNQWPDDKEEVLKKAAPHLSRCPRCWKGEK